MITLLTNTNTKTALEVLRANGSQINSAERRVSTGYAVATAADDAAYWSIATTMRSDSKTLSAVEDALGMAAAVVDTAANGFSNATEALKDVKALLVLAREPGVDREKIGTDLDELKAQLKSVAHASSFSGENWLWRSDASQDADRNLVASFNRSADGTIKLVDMTYEIAGQAGTSDVNFLVDDASGESGILTGSGFASELGTSKDWVLFNGENGPIHTEMALSKTTSDADIDEMITVVDAMAERAIDVGSTLGSLSSRVALQTSFAGNLTDSLSRGVGKMVDADMDQESSRLRALQAQRMLGSQSLSIINASASVFRQLFN
ncbi:flagellin [Rhizobium halophytocola]|uniref:Flagellin n=1 Tax=Rhizobium halophytocola TaxID=735519 RepID=A0ABS4DX46_9HYPH|nr:flagellin [Rhizobium halophytocola]MBP1850261.1 flagellin [Rhizobium halophytocola]